MASSLLKDPPVQGQDDYLFQLALAHEQAGELELARNVILKTLQPQAFPHHLPTLLLAGRVFARLGSNDENGVILAERALAEAEVSSAGGSGLAEAYRNLGVNLLLRSRAVTSSNERKEILQRSEVALSSATSSNPPPSGAFVDLALVLAEREKHEEALATAKRALQSGGGSSCSTWQMLALLLSTQQRHENAAEMCRLGLKSVPWPQNAPLQELLGLLQREAGSFLEAAATFKGFLQLVERDEEQAESQGYTEGQVWLLLASVYTAARKFHDAAACITKAEDSKKHALYWNTLGELYEAKGDVSSACKAYSRAVSLGQGGSSKSNLGAALMNIGGSSSQLAKEYLQEALADDPLNHTAWFNMGLVSQQYGDVVHAAECFRKSRLLGESRPVIPFSSVLPTLSRPH